MRDQIEQLYKKDLPIDLMPLQEEYQALVQLSATIDPYKGLTEKERDTLAQLNIRCWDNPFNLTNEILQKMMELEEKINEYLDSNC